MPRSRLELDQFKIIDLFILDYEKAIKILIDARSFELEINISTMLDVSWSREKHLESTYAKFDWSALTSCRAQLARVFKTTLLFNI